jgi:hypothetical protein
MNEFVNNGGFTKLIAIIVIALLTLGAGILLGVVLIDNIVVNTAVLVSLGGIVGSGMTYFAKASGVSDGAAIVQNAVNSVTTPMVTAINSSPGPIQGSIAPVNGVTPPIA